MKYQMIRKADAKIERHVNRRGNAVASLHIGNLEHWFDPSSRVSRALETTTVDDIQERFKGGTFFWVDGQLVDFRDRQYNGFIQDDASIAALVKVIGIRERKKISTHLSDNQTSRSIVLGCKWDASEFTIEEFEKDGTFENELLFGWSPFAKDVTSAFMIKQVSTGFALRGMSSFLRKRIPLVNRWEEHLNISCKQLQARINSEVNRRFRKMAIERASVQELMLISQHADKRLNENFETINGTGEEARLRRIMLTANPIVHTNKVYKEAVYRDMRLAAQHEAHLSLYDTYLLTTEMRTFTAECEGSSTLALDRFGNDLIFNHTDLTQYGTRFEQTKAPIFKDTEAAFYGNTED